MSPACARAPVMPPLKSSDAAGVVEERLARRRGAEPLRLAPVVVADDGDVGQGGGGPPEVGLLPAVGKAARLQEET